MAKIRQSNLDEAIVTGLTELSEGRADGDFALIYDASTGTLKKIQASNLGIIAPTLSSISPTNVNTGDGTGNATFTVTGANFATGTSAVLVTTSGSEVAFDTVTRDSSTQLTCVIAVSSLSNANEPYDIKVTSNSLSATLTDQVNINAQPIFTTASGSLGSSRFNMSGIEVNATDPESAANVTFELQSGSLPPGVTLVNTGANGGTATFTGDFSSLAASDTTYNFTLRAVDAASNTSSRAFSFTALGPQYQSFTSSGTFTVPSGLTAVDVLVVAGGGGGGVGHPYPNYNAGGGGGAGGLIFFPCYPVTTGTLTVTVGNGGAGGTATPQFGATGGNSVFGSPTDPGLSPTGEVLTAQGGGRGNGGYDDRYPGGSGGGAGNDARTSYPSGPLQGGCGTQPTAPGDSGAYGFGFPGQSNPGPSLHGGSGGGAGGAAQRQPCGQGQWQSGIGKSYTIADGTTPVYYAGGGGGGGGYNNVYGWITAGAAAQGGGGGGGGMSNPGPDATANRGGGGGGGGKANPQTPVGGGCGTFGQGGAGGKGIVIVKY